MSALTLTLTPEERATLIEDARRDMVKALLLEKRQGLDLLTTVEVCGLMDIDRNTLERLGIPRVTIVAGRVYRYSSSEIAKWLRERTYPAPKGDEGEKGGRP